MAKKNALPQTELQALEAELQEKATIVEKLLQENAALTKELESLLQTAPTAAPSAPTVPAETFKVDGETYHLTLTEYIIKGIGRRTALEVLLDDTDYAELNGLTIKAHLVSYPNIGFKKA